IAVALGFGWAGFMPWWNSVAASMILAGQATLPLIYWVVGRHRGYPIGDFAFHEGIDVIVLTIVIHFAGGIHLPYAALVYLFLVLFAAVAESRRIALRLAVLSIVSLLTLVALEESGIVRSFSAIWGYRLPVPAQLLALVVSGIFLIHLAVVGGTLADKLKD